MFSVTEFTRPGSSKSGEKLVERVARKESSLKYSDQSVEDVVCGD